MKSVPGEGLGDALRRLYGKKKASSETKEEADQVASEECEGDPKRLVKWGVPNQDSKEVRDASK